MPGPDDVAALARSSPWRWSTLRFTARWTGPRSRIPTVRAWLRRPDLLRVETLDGALLRVVREEPPVPALLTAYDDRTVRPPWPDVPEVPAPEMRADGLVARRPDRSAVSVDAPMFENYFWVAMLDPVELADGRDPETGAEVAGAVLDDVRVVEHGGRPAWEALARPTPAYEPRCGCCPLLRSPEGDEREYGDDRALDSYPEACRVRVDLGTGVCVFTEEIGGSTPGAGHDVRIEAVDEPVDDALFAGAR